jgi:hypothetical protein
MDKKTRALVDEVKQLIKTEPYPHNETNIEDWIEEGDTESMTAQEIADEWDEVNAHNPKE